MIIYLAADHRGFELKEKIKQWLEEWGYEYQDMGAFELDANDDYVDFVAKAAKKVSEDPENSRAIVLGRSGQGEAIAANKFKGVRAVVYYGGEEEIVSLSREHNDANVLSLGASFIDHNTAKSIIKLWLQTPFSDENRHSRRLQKIKELEDVW